MKMITNNAWPARIHRLLASAVFAAAIACASAGTAAAQAGSTGGTIGKQDKSISGSERAVAPRPAKTQRQGRNKPASGRGAQASCRSIVGTWASWASGVYGKQDTKIKADGTLTHPTSKGTWSCTAGEYIHVWDAFGVRGPYTLSPDGKRLIKIKDGSVSFSRN